MKTLKTTLALAVLVASAGAMAQASGGAAGSAGTTGVVTGATSATTSTGIAPADGSNTAATPTPGATLQSSSGLSVTTTVMGAPSATAITTRSWPTFPSNVEAR